jgi:hypothetical protein
VTKAFAKFEIMVNERGYQLRRLTYEQLKQLEKPTEYIMVESQRATIATIVTPVASDEIRVVVKGCLKKRFWPMIYSVALDGFNKFSDETIVPLAREDLREFD